MRKSDEKHKDKLRKKATRGSEQASKSSGPKEQKIPRSAAARANAMKEKYGIKPSKPTVITGKGKEGVASNLKGDKQDKKIKNKKKD